MADPITFERESLYEEIWTDAVSTVSKRYGLSDNGLRKICRKLGVPLPPLGYWAKLRAGQTVKRPQLLKHTGPTTFIANAESHRHYGGPNTDHAYEKRLIKSEEAAPENRIVPTVGVWRHPLVKALAKSLEKRDWLREASERPGRSNEPRLLFLSSLRSRAGVIAPDYDHLAVVVTPAQRQRALAIADAFLLAVEARGFKVRIDRDTTYLTCLDIEVKFRMSEMTGPVGKGANSTQKALGRLRITLTSTFASASSFPRELKARDEPGVPLESHLNSMAARLRGAVPGVQDRAVARELASQQAAEKQALEEERAQQRYEAAQAAKREQARVDAMFAEADLWGTVERRRAYLDQLELVGRERGLLAETDSPLAVWLAWARAACDRMDPLEKRLSPLR